MYDKHLDIEEPDEVKISSPVLKPSRTGRPSGLGQPYPNDRESDREKVSFLPLRLPLLLILVLGLALAMSLMLLHYGEIALAIWTPNYTLANVTPPLPSALAFGSFAEILASLARSLLKGGVVAGLILLLLIRNRIWSIAIATAVSFIFGSILSANWTRVLPFFHPNSFGQSDPIFHREISFYIFQFPLWQLLDFWLEGLIGLALVAVCLTYLVSGNSLSEGKFSGFSRSQLLHLYSLGGAMMLVVGLRHWLERYLLLYSPLGVTYGASYTDINIVLPVKTILSLLAVGIAIGCFVKAIADSKARKRYVYQSRQSRRTIPFLVFAFSVYAIVILAGAIATESVQRLTVQPNELAKEQVFIKRSIAATRAGFDLNKIESKTFDPEGTLTADDIAKNRLTIDNIRLWDKRTLLETNRQLQQIRLYYRFPDADIDRYTIEGEKDRSAIAAKRQQVIIAARELDYRSVPEQAQTWLNEHLVYTHGYGFTLSPVNRVARGGLPYYFVKDIGVNGEQGALNVSDDAIAASIPTENPRIYYGEISNTYVMTNTKVKEFDSPSGQDNIYNIYDGTGGINIGSPWRRWLFAAYLKDWQMLFTQNFTPQTRLLFRRDINRRIREIAPFLSYDRDPYLVVADTEQEARSPSKNYLYWIVDAYTTSDRYPYSDPGNNSYNYIRNSVKVVIDAYNGDVNFYVADATDPIVQTWQQIFPGLFQPLSAMPVNLRRHMRYPQDLLNVQSERLLTYHMTDAQVFYNREDQWQIPQEIYDAKPQPVLPYYLIMALPTATNEEFILVHAYTPQGRNNLIALLFARSDGSEYGKLLLYQLPKQKLIYGSEQIEALINQDPVISQQISLWNRQGSRVIQGNLLAIPVEESLLYVEPLYLKAEQNSLPTLARAIVVYNNQIIMAPTLQEALQAIFEPKNSSSTIIRQVEEDRSPRSQ